MVGRCKKNSFWPERKGACTSKGVLREPQDRGSAEVALYRFGRVKHPHTFWLKMGLNSKPQVQKVVPGLLGFVKGVDSFPPFFPPGLLLSVFWVCFLVRSGEYKFWAISGVDLFPSLVVPRIGFRG